MIDPFIRPEAVGSFSPPGPFGRDAAAGRASLKDMAARTTRSYDAEVISTMNRSNPRVGTLPSDGAGVGSSQYVSLSGIYGRQGSSGPGSTVERSPSINNMGPPPPPDPSVVVDADAVPTDLPPTVQTARSVRPSVVLVTSKGVRKESSQGSGFVVAFDDAQWTPKKTRTGATS